MSDLNLEVDLGPFSLKNPVLTASGTFGYGKEVKDYMDPDLLGAITVKGLTVEPTRGNDTPRIVETASGMLNSIGLENPGLEEFIEQKIEVIGEFSTPVLVNISGHSVEDFSVLAGRLAPYDEIAGLEVNVSCPNIEGGGMAFGTNCDLVYQITEEVKSKYEGPVIVKLSPNVTDIVEMAEAARAGGADCISLINTLLGMAIDVDSQAPVLGNTMGGLSGPAIKPVALRMIYQVAAVVDLPIIGMGGIMNGEDALEFIMAGASAVAIGTATLVNPDASINVLQEIKQYCRENNIDDINQLVGIAHR
ncbi:MAG: dihydroorotate dehydrogenase [Bacillota bacterium]